MKKIWNGIAKDLWIVLLDIIAVNAAYFFALLIRFYVDELTLEELEAEEHISVSQIKRRIYPKARMIFRMMDHK